VKAVRFADDQAVVADTEKGLQEVMDVLQAKSKDYNMTINLKTSISAMAERPHDTCSITVIL